MSEFRAALQALTLAIDRCRIDAKFYGSVTDSQPYAEAKALLARPEPPESLLAAEINALPERTRRFVHDLETRYDPAGDVRRAHEAEEQVAALVKMIEEDRATTEPEPRLTRDEAMRLLEHYRWVHQDETLNESHRENVTEACIAAMLRSEVAPTGIYELQFSLTVLADADKALAVLFTMLTKEKLMQGAAVSDEIRSHVRSAIKQLSHLREASAMGVTGQ